MAHELMRVSIGDETKITPSVTCPDVCDVAAPDQVGSKHYQILHQVWIFEEMMLGIRCPDSRPASFRQQMIGPQ
jgi:hypothetical protein